MRKRDQKMERDVLLTEHDVLSMDPVLFEDPILLLEYLQGLDEGNPSKPSRTVPEETKNSSKKAKAIRIVKTAEKTSEPRLLYGYDMINGEVKINLEQAEAVSRIISLHEKGYSYSQIEYMMGDTKYRTVTGKKFYISAIQLIVKNKKVYEGETGYPPIIIKSNLISKQKIDDDHHDSGKEQVSTPAPGYSPASSPYWEAVRKLRESIEQRKRLEEQKEEVTGKKIYKNIDDFLTFIKSKGVPVKDNRWNDGCVWVRADVSIADIMPHVEIKGRGFRYTPKCKAFHGEPGWYY